MLAKYSPAFGDYEPAFEATDRPFLFFYRIEPDRTVSVTTYTRGSFLSLARKAAGALKGIGCGVGDRILHCFGANDPNDLAFRLAGALIGTVPVTVNWQADPLERVIYKYRVTGASMVVVSPSFSPELLAGLRQNLPHVPFFDSQELGAHSEIPEEDCLRDLDSESTKIIIFTSGTTGSPKGVELTYGNYVTNRATFEQMLEIAESDRFAALVVNPLHHTNSTAITDWALRRPGSHLHLVERYSTNYWAILVDVVAREYDRIVAPTVSRHFDFLEDLSTTDRLPVELDRLRNAMSKVDFLIGSAPVGPTTVERLQSYAGTVPTVRFGSTETCLQVVGIPRSLGEEARLEVFRKGWEHRIGGEETSGYYIGRPHQPHTEVRIVKGITRGEEGYLADTEPGIPGYLITRGGNVMKGYVGDPEATQEVFDGGWYLGLKDICFALENDHDGQLDYFWMSREVGLLIKGGANYSCEQIGAELSAFIVRRYKLPQGSFGLAVVGLKIDSEHEDSCCVTVELFGEDTEATVETLEKTFIEGARAVVSKSAKPDYFRIGKIPRNFKGAVLVPDLRNEYEAYLSRRTTSAE